MANTAAVRYAQAWTEASSFTEPKFSGLEVPALKALFKRGLSTGRDCRNQWRPVFGAHFSLPAHVGAGDAARRSLRRGGSG